MDNPIGSLLNMALTVAVVGFGVYGVYKYSETPRSRRNPRHKCACGCNAGSFTDGFSSCK